MPLTQSYIIKLGLLSKYKVFSRSSFSNVKICCLFSSVYTIVLRHLGISELWIEQETQTAQKAELTFTPSSG